MRFHNPFAQFGIFSVLLYVQEVVTLKKKYSNIFASEN